LAPRTPANGDFVTGSERSGPAFSSALPFGAQGRAAEGSLLAFYHEFLHRMPDPSLLREGVNIRSNWNECAPGPQLTLAMLLSSASRL